MSRRQVDQVSRTKDSEQEDSEQANLKRNKKMHIVDGCEVPHHVVAKVKTSKLKRKHDEMREPTLWRPIGEMVLAFWLACNKPPLATPIFLSRSGPNKGFPPKAPSDWAQTHYRRLMESRGLVYDRDDSFYSLRHIGANLLAIGPRFTPRQIAEFMGNSAAIALDVYNSAVRLEQYADKSMEQIIAIALERVGLPSLAEIVQGASERSASRRRERIAADASPSCEPLVRRRQPRPEPTTLQLLTMPATG